MPHPSHTPPDPTIHVGLRLYDGTDYDTIIERVEYGGFGVIAFGPNRLDNQRVIAYKTLRRDLLKDPQTRAGFIRECLLWVGLWPHPNVALAYGAFEMGDSIGQRPFLALAYAEHGSLRKLLRSAAQQPGGRLPLEAGLHFAQQIAAGLAYLHQPEPTYRRKDPTVHRDLKPENVLLMSDGRAVITDFGLAKAVEESPLALALLLSQSSLGVVGQQGQQGQPGQTSRQAEEAILVGGEEATETTGLHTAAGMALGTLAYMPPEQWEDARYARTPADIYALGIMLSEILAGRHALLDLDQPHSQADWRNIHRNPQPRPIREVAPNVPVEVERIYQRCLARDPDDRPSAAEVLAALQAGAGAVGVEVYTPLEFVRHTPFNEWVHWHMWSIAYDSFELYSDALACSNQAMPLVRQLASERPELLPGCLMERGDILAGLGAEAIKQGNMALAKSYDDQAEAAYQESLATRPPTTTTEGRKGRASVWNQVGIFNRKRKRYNYADDAYDRSLTLEPGAGNTYFNRALNQREWGLAERQEGRLESAVTHMRQARVYAVTSIALSDPTAPALLEDIKAILQRWGVTDHE